MGLHKRRFWAYPPKDYGKWQNLIAALAQHCVDRYGEAEVLTWYWELWNEPDIFYWQGTREEFLQLFDHTETALHSVLPAARLGGPGTTDPNPGAPSLAFFEAFLDHCRNGRHAVTGETGTRLDFITFHTKGGGFPFKPDAHKATPSVEKQVSQVRTGLDAMHRHGFDGLEVVLSEADPDGWAAGGIHDNPNMKFRNTAYYASYVACGYHHMERLARHWRSPVRPLAWAFLFRGERCFEGTRTFSTQGIDKPVLNVFRLFSRLGNTCLPLQSSGERQIPTAIPKAESATEMRSSANTSAISNAPDTPNTSDTVNTSTISNAPDLSGTATKTADGRILVLLYSHHDDWDLQKSASVTLTVTGLSACSGTIAPTQGQRMTLSHWRIDSEHSNAHTQWQVLGSPEYPSPDQITALKQRQGLELLSPPQTVSVVDNQVQLSFVMPTHAVSLIELQTAPD